MRNRRRQWNERRFFAKSAPVAGLALGGVLLTLTLSAGTAKAQYYPPSRYGYDPGYPPGYIPYGRGYGRSYHRFDYYRRRPPLARDDYGPSRPRKAKQERFDEPKPDLAKATPTKSRSRAPITSSSRSTRSTFRSTAATG